MAADIYGMYNQGKDNLLLFPAAAPPPSRLSLPSRATNGGVVCSSFTNRPHEMFDLTGRGCSLEL